MTPHTQRHLKAIKDYCNGIGLRIICNRYSIHDGEVVKRAIDIGITKRPMGFASYTIAHEWVTEARKQYEEKTTTTGSGIIGVNSSIVSDP